MAACSASRASRRSTCCRCFSSSARACSFPFARQIIAEATRNGGFPPLMLDPIDFAQMFQQKIAEEQAKAKVQVS
jgi:preprotein translocase subunit SecB